MTWVLILGLLMNVVALPLAAKRVGFLARLITSGQPAPDRIEGVTGRVGLAIKTQVVEVFGQKKLLKWSVPGVAHFFVFWAFLILGTVYVEAYGSLFTYPEEFAIPIVGTWDLLGFAQDLIAVLAVVGPGALRPDPAEELPEEAGPSVPLQGLAPRRRLGRALHDLQRHLDDVPLPRRRRGPRQLPLRQRGVRLAGGRQRCSTASASTPSRSSRASA